MNYKDCCSNKCFYYLYQWFSEDPPSHSEDEDEGIWKELDRGGLPPRKILLDLNGNLHLLILIPIFIYSTDAILMLDGLLKLCGLLLRLIFEEVG